MKILVEYTIDPAEIEKSRAQFHDHAPLSTEVIFADDLQSHAHDGEGCLYGNFIVRSVQKDMGLNQALDEFSVMDADEVEPPPNLTGWFAVVDESGINAYFSTQQAAFRHRLDLINRRLNG